MKIRISYLVFWLLLAAPLVARGQTASIVGDWTGESICVGEIGACKDEQVVYHISVDPSDATKVKISADKIINGKPEPMGDIFLKYDSSKQTLTGEMQNPRYHMLWEFTIKGNMMWGTLTLLPEKRVGRQIRVSRSETTQGKSTMTEHANGTFEVKLAPQDDKSSDKSLGRMTIDKQWHGDLEGSSVGQMLTGGDASSGSAGYVAIEKFTGTVKGRKGTFIFQHSATMMKGKGDLSIFVVPDSGTDQLAGISGKLMIKIENGKHSYDFEYSIK